MAEQEETRPVQPETEPIEVAAEASPTKEPAPGLTPTAQDAPSNGAAKPEPVEAGPLCPWCSTPTPPGADKCPACQATLVPAVDPDTAAIPGVTEVPENLLSYKPAPRKPQKIVDLLIKLLDEEDQVEPEAATPPADPADPADPAEASDPVEGGPGPAGGGSSEASGS